MVHSNIKKSLEWQDTDYKTYRLSKKEWLICIVRGVAGIGLLSFVFYRSAAVFVFLLPLGFCYPLVMRDFYRKKRQEQLLLQFKDAALSISACLTAGYSVENACLEALREVTRIYGNDAMISKEIRLMIHKTQLNRTMEEALMDFAERSGLADIKSFADVFSEARTSGGELMKIIARTADIISEKIRIQQDILTSTTSRRLEQSMMCVVPVGMVFYMEFTSPGFFTVLYETMPGRIIMTCCLLAYLGAMAWGRKILDIAV